MARKIGIGNQDFEIKIVQGWFDSVLSEYKYFNKPSKKQPERFYHGFVLGLMVKLADKYLITSNGESGLGRYDIMLEPRSQINSTTINHGAKLDAIIIEFKVQDKNEKKLSDTVQEALRQITEKTMQHAL